MGYLVTKVQNIDPIYILANTPKVPIRPKLSLLNTAQMYIPSGISLILDKAQKFQAF